MRNITGIILAGGKSLRMGTDKAFITIDEKPLVEIVMDKMSTLFEDVLLIVNNPLPYEKYRRRAEIKTDLIPECGPLGGIYTGLEASRNPLTFVVACDMPFINMDLLRYMIHTQSDAETVVCEYGGRLHPLCAVYARRCAPVFKESLDQGNFKMRDVLGRLKTKRLQETEIREFDPEGLSFMNMNTPEDYQRCLANV